MICFDPLPKMLGFSSIIPRWRSCKCQPSISVLHRITKNFNFLTSGRGKRHLSFFDELITFWKRLSEDIDSFSQILQIILLSVASHCRFYNMNKSGQMFFFSHLFSIHYYLLELVERKLYVTINLTTCNDKTTATIGMYIFISGIPVSFCTKDYFALQGKKNS